MKNIKDMNMEISQEDRVYTAAIINFFWPDLNFSPDRVTQEIVFFASDALSVANTCTDDIGLVPRPSGFKPDIKWALKQIRKIGQRFIDKNPGVYFMCKVTVGIKMKSEFLRIFMGY